MPASKVYFTDFRCRNGVSQLDKLRKLLEKSEFSQIDFDGKFVAIKLHFGELGNLSFLRANYAKVVADFINGTKNTMQGTAEIHVEPRLASDSAWFLLCTKRPVKPLIYQQRKKAKFVSKTNETDDNVFMSKKFIYGADSRGNAGFGFWQMAYGSDGITT